MRMFGILDTTQGLSLDFLNNRVFYTMLLGALMFNYFYLIMFGGLSLMYNIISGFSMSSLVIGYLLHYAVPFEPEDFRKLTSEFRDRIRDDASSVLDNLNINWTKSLTTDTSEDNNEETVVTNDENKDISSHSDESELADESEQAIESEEGSIEETDEVDKKNN